MFVSELEQFDPQNLFSLTFSSGDCWCIQFVLFVWCNAGIYIILHIRFFLPMEYTFSCYTFHYSKLVEILEQAFKVNSRRVNSLWSVLSNYGLVWKSLLNLKWFKWQQMYFYFEKVKSITTQYIHLYQTFAKKSSWILEWLLKQLNWQYVPLVWD